MWTSPGGRAGRFSQDSHPRPEEHLAQRGQWSSQHTIGEPALPEVRKGESMTAFCVRHREEYDLMCRALGRMLKENGTGRARGASSVTPAGGSLTGIRSDEGSDVPAVPDTEGQPAPDATTEGREGGQTVLGKDPGSGVPPGILGEDGGRMATGRPALGPPRALAKAAPRSRRKRTTSFRCSPTRSKDGFS